MVTRVSSVAFHGIEVVAVDVQVQMASGLPHFQVVGLPDKAVGESRERVRGALAALGLALPPKRITVNLAPADLTKEGSHFDLPIACGYVSTREAWSIYMIADRLKTEIRFRRSEKKGRPRTRPAPDGRQRKEKRGTGYFLALK